MGIEQISNIIRDFISKSDPDTIKGWNISPVIINPSKHKKFWFSISIQFSTAFDYDEAFISELKGKVMCRSLLPECKKQPTIYSLHNIQ